MGGEGNEPEGERTREERATSPSAFPQRAGVVERQPAGVARPRVVYVATKNLGKLRELVAIFEPAGWQLTTFPSYRDVEEGDASYADNAALKARALRDQLIVAGIRSPVLGDDSGLEVEALGGRPGVRSARYGGDDASWPQRRAWLLEELRREGSGNRNARFVCALHYIAADGREIDALAYFAGALTEVERGERGFSYDPIFVSVAHGATFAELDERQKNRISHRARAAAALLAALATRPDFANVTGKSPTSGT